MISIGYTPSHSRKQKIKEFGKTWWGHRWADAISGAASASEGARYACEGAVQAVQLQSGLIRADVQSTGPKPFAVRFEIKPFTDEQWDRLFAELDNPSLFAAGLLGGDLVPSAETAFERAGLRLVPKRFEDMKLICPCTDWFKPCSHQVAVWLVVVVELDRDPALLFRLRGRTLDQLLERLRVDRTAPEILASQPEPEPEPARSFWQAGPIPLNLRENWKPRLSAKFPEQWGQISFWRGAIPFRATMEKIYPAAAEYSVTFFKKK